MAGLLTRAYSWSAPSQISIQWHTQHTQAPTVAGAVMELQFMRTMFPFKSSADSP